MQTDALALAARRAEAAADAEAAAAAAAEARHAPDEGDAAAQAIFEAHPAFGVDWSSCRDSEAKGLAFVEERQPGPVRKYEFTYEQFCGPDNVVSQRHGLPSIRHGDTHHLFAATRPPSTRGAWKSPSVGAVPGLGGLCKAGTAWVWAGMV